MGITQSIKLTKELEVWFRGRLRKDGSSEVFRRQHHNLEVLLQILLITEVLPLRVLCIEAFKALKYVFLSVITLQYLKEQFTQ